MLKKPTYHPHPIKSGTTEKNYLHGSLDTVYTGVAHALGAGQNLSSHYVSHFLKNFIVLGKKYIFTYK